MAEAFAALGAAAAIAQFVDIGLKSISKAKEVLQSADGLTKTNDDLRMIAADCEEQSSLLLSNASVVKPGSPLSDLLKQSTQVATELTKELKWLQFDPKTARKRDKARAVWRTLLDKDAIPQLERRLSSLRAQICTHILLSLHNHQTSLIKSAASAEDSTREWNLATTKKLDGMARDLQQALKGNNDMAKTMLPSLATELKSYADQASHRSRIEAILKGLRFEHIRERESRVETAHKATFQWIFDPNTPVNLGPWLQTGNGTYWIEGKAGSGKSTLMKYLLQHKETTRSLQQWAGNKKLFIGSHFFWTMGTDLQKSQLGLLRTMLFQLLKGHPDLIPVACPERLSAKDYEHLESWTMEALIRAFDLLLSYKKLPLRMCFFIDGLDEYGGIHADLVQLLDSFAKSDSIKLCVSSRPWPEFRDAYGATPFRLCIHEHTRPDIYAFAHGRLTENPRFEALRKDFGKEAEELIDDIASRAEGVFLWVYYVVRSLLRGLSNRDDVGVLRRRLHEFPRELTDFFQHMFNAIDSVYKPQAAALLKMLAAHDQPIPILALISLDSAVHPTWKDMLTRRLELDAQRRSPVPPLLSPFETKPMLPFSPSRFQQERDAFTDRCRDLLHAVDMGEAGSPPDYWDIRIGFLHRTVSDFISTTQMDLVLVSWLAPDFHPHIQLLHAFALGVNNSVASTQNGIESIDPDESRSDNKRWQCVKSSLLDLIRLAKDIHEAGNLDTMSRAQVVFEKLSFCWGRIFLPPMMKNSLPGLYDQNDWIVQDRLLFPTLESMADLDGYMKWRSGWRFGALGFCPASVWQFLGALGLTGYVTACPFPSFQRNGGASSDGALVTLTLKAKEAILGAFSREAILDDSEDGRMQLRYTKRWNTAAIRALLLWYGAHSTKAAGANDPALVGFFWQQYMVKMLFNHPEKGGALPWEESLEMAKVLLASGAERLVPLPAAMMLKSAYLRAGAEKWLRKAIAEQPPLKGSGEGKDDPLWPVDCLQLLLIFFGEEEASELEHMFQAPLEHPDPGLRARMSALYRRR